MYSTLNPFADARGKCNLGIEIDYNRQLTLSSLKSKHVIFVCYSACCNNSYVPCVLYTINNNYIRRI